MSKNSFDLIGSTGSKLAGKKGKAFLGSFFYLLPMLGICAIPYAGWAIGILLFGFLTPGYINFMQSLLKNENPKYEVIFRGKGDIIASILLGIVLAGGMILGTALAIIPGMFFAVYFSMSFFFLNEKDITNVFGSMGNCAKNMKGNLVNLFSYKVIFYIYYVITTLACAALAFMVWALLDILWLAIILYIIIALAFIVLTALCTMFFYTANCIFYEEVIAYQEEKKARSVKTIEKETVAVTAKPEAKATKPVAAPVAAPKKPEAKTDKKPAPKKPAAKKPAAKTTKPVAASVVAPKKPAANTAKKPAAKKPVAKTAAKPAAKKTVVKKAAVKK